MPDLPRGKFDPGTDARYFVFGSDRRFCDVVIRDPKVSNRHCVMWQDVITGAVWVEDLRSLNGTFLLPAGWSRSAYGRLLTGPARLNLGDAVRIGDTVLPWNPPRL